MGLFGFAKRLFQGRDAIGPDFSALDVYFHSGQSQARVMEIFTKVINSPELVPPGELVMVYYLRARIFAFRNEFDQAIDDCTKAIELDPSYAGAYSSRGRFYLPSRRFDLAKADLEKALELDPTIEESKEALVWLARHTRGV